MFHIPLVLLALLALVGQALALNRYVGGRVSNKSSPLYNEMIDFIGRPSCPAEYSGEYVWDREGPSFLQEWEISDCSTLHTDYTDIMARFLGSKDADKWGIPANLLGCGNVRFCIPFLSLTVCGEFRKCVLDKPIILKSCVPWKEGRKAEGPTQLGSCSAFPDHNGIPIEACVCDQDDCNVRIQHHYESCSDVGSLSGLKRYAVKAGAGKVGYTPMAFGILMIFCSVFGG